MSINYDKLAAKIDCVNRANVRANALRTELMPIFAPYKGLKVVNKDGSFVKSIRDKLPEFEHTPAIHIYRYHSDYSVVYMVQTAGSVNGWSVSYETGVYLCQLRDGVMIDTYNHDNFPTYDMDKIINAINETERLKAELASVQAGLSPFEEFFR